jgi:subtilisin family serine protease
MLVTALMRQGTATAVVVLVCLLVVGGQAAALPTSSAHTDPQPPTVVVAAQVRHVVDKQAQQEIADELEAVVSDAGGKVRRSKDVSGIVSAEVPADVADELTNAFDTIDGLRSATQPALFSLSRVPSDPQFRLQRSYLSEVAVPRAWNRSRGRKATTIAVIDSGVATGHPDLRRKVVAARNAVYGGRSVRDRIGHGTAVASVAAADTANRIGIAGVGWRTSVMAVKVADRQGRIWGDALARGIRWATRQGADVINLSLGSSRDDPMVRRAVAHAVSNDVLVVAAVSNRGGSAAVYPAAYPGVLGVGASRGDKVAAFSDRGPFVDVMAPGVAIRAAVPGGYSRVDGTSFAAAVVSGQASLIRPVKPGMSASRVSRTIVATSQRIAGAGASSRRIQVFNSVVSALGIPRPPRGVTATPDGRSVAVTWRPPRALDRTKLLRYRIHVREIGKPWRVATRVGQRREAAIIDGLTPGRHAVKVVAISTVGAGLHSPPVRFRTR